MNRGDDLRQATGVAVDDDAGRMFSVSLAYLVIVGFLGAFLRWLHVHPIDGVAYGNWLHAHSHVAFLGFVFNAYYALAMATFAPSEDRQWYRWLFWALQVPVLGMFVAFPIQGYGAASIAFSTLHLAGVAAFAWRLWRNNRASTSARHFLRLALLAMVASGLGPLALGPLAAAGLRDTPAYTLSIYFYLHAQYNGWFRFLPAAVVLQGKGCSEQADTRRISEGRNAAHWCAAGFVLTFAQSTLWLSPPVWVNLAGAAGALAQIIGAAYFARIVRGAAGRGGAVPASRSRLEKGLWWIAAFSLALKLLLQLGSVVPELVRVASQRHIVVAFLHLVFLGIVVPIVVVFGIRFGWLKEKFRLGVSLLVFFCVFALAQLALVLAGVGCLVPLSAPAVLSSFAAAMAAALLAAFGLPRKRSL